MLGIISNKKLLKQVIDKSTKHNKEVMLVFFNDKYKEVIGGEKEVGNVNELLAIPGKVSLIFHTHPQLTFKNRILTVYPSATDVEMSIFLHRYPQYKNATFAIGGLINRKYIVCYWSYDTINFELLNKIEYKIFSGNDTEDNRESLGKAIGLQCLNLKSMSLSEIAEQQQQNLYRKIAATIRNNDYVVFDENISEIKDALEKMFPVLDKYYDYEKNMGIVYTYYFLVSIDGNKIELAKAKIYKDRIEVITMSTSENGIIRIGNKNYTIQMLKNLY